MIESTHGSGRGTPGGGWAARVATQLERVAAEGRLRAPRDFDAVGPEGVLVAEGREVVSFASNDYLGLSCHPTVLAAAHNALDRWGAGAGASRLITGSRPVHRELEDALARWRQTEAAVCFPTGFAANLGVLSVLGGPGTRILSDELNHASIVDGCRLARGDVAVYRHADTDHLAAILTATEGPSVVVTDAVFSMDGDVAPLSAIAEVCRRHRALLIVDEAHSVIGPSIGSEITEDLTLVRVGTLSKTLGSLGGFVATSKEVVDLLVNLARPYIFTTALTPPDAAAALAALGVLCSSEGAERIARLRGHVERVAAGRQSPIVPIMLGTEESALRASAALLDAGIWVPAIRPPTVPEGSSRLRVTLSGAHSDAQVDLLVKELANLSAAVGADER